MQVIKAFVEWKEKGKPVFKGDKQYHIELKEETANLDFIVTAIRKKWGKEYSLVTSDGIELEDSPATTGMKWKLQCSGNFNVCDFNVCVNLVLLP